MNKDDFGMGIIVGVVILFFVAMIMALGYAIKMPNQALKDRFQECLTKTNDPNWCYERVIEKK